MNKLFVSILYLSLILTTFTACKDDDGDEITPEPIITAIHPEKGVAGTVVAIQGSGFAKDAVVKFNGTEVTVMTVEESLISVVLDDQATTGAVTVHTNGKTATGPSFKVQYIPRITSISPEEGYPGTEVTITGTHFSSTISENTVEFYGAAATVLSASPTQLTVLVPDTDSGPVTVQVDGITSTSAIFNILQPVKIDDLSATSATACTSITIYGVNFSETASENIVKFNDVVATVTSASDSELVVTVPSGATSGDLTVTTKGNTATWESFTILINEATMKMDDVDHTYSGFCSSVVSGRFWVSAHGGGSSTKPSWAIHFTGGKPTAAGEYSADIIAERGQEVWDATPATVQVAFDNTGRMTITFTNVLLKGRVMTPDKPMSGEAIIY